MSPTAFIRNSLIGAAALLAVAGTINYRVDPFQQYRVPTSYTPRFYHAYQRHENPGIARHYDYDRAVVGSSFFENITASEVDRAFGPGKTMNLCLGGMTAYDARKLIEVMLANRKVKRIIYSVDYNAFSGPPNRTGLPEPLPVYLYDSAIWNDYPYLLSVLTLRKSADILLGRHEPGYSTDRDKPWYWANEEEFSAKGVVQHLDPDDLNKRFAQPQRTMEGMWKSFEANVPPLLEAHPETTIDFVWPPYSLLVWLDFRQRDQLELSLAFKRRFVQALAKYPNARIYDFQARQEWITNFDQYRDIYHFSPRISSAIVTDIAAGRERETPANVDDYNARVRALALAHQPREVIGELLNRAELERRRGRLQ
jgi:hypothetical protein